MWQYGRCTIVMLVFHQLAYFVHTTFWNKKLKAFAHFIQLWTQCVNEAVAPFSRCCAKFKILIIYGDFEFVSFIPMFGALGALSQWHAVQLQSDVRLAHVRNSVTHSCIIMIFTVYIVKGNMLGDVCVRGQFAHNFRM